MPIVYSLEPDLTAEEFRDVLVSSGLAARRPADDLARLDRMLRGAEIVVTAREGGKLIGISRAITDYSFCCYLSDLAVDGAYQGRGIGRRLIEETHDASGPLTGLYLVSAPAAVGFYSRIEMASYPCFGIRARK